MTIYTTGQYEVVLAESPSTATRPITVYGVKNISTGVIEAYVGELPKAMALADSLAYEVAHHDPQGYAKAAATFDRAGGIAGLLKRIKGQEDEDDGPGFTFNG